MHEPCRAAAPREFEFRDADRIGAAAVSPLRKMRSRRR
jgi:hypothetical protein